MQLVKHSQQQATLRGSQITTRRFSYTHTQPMFFNKLYRETSQSLPCCHIVVLFVKTSMRKVYLSRRLSTSAHVFQTSPCLPATFSPGWESCSGSLASVFTFTLTGVVIKMHIIIAHHFGDQLLDLVQPIHPSAAVLRGSPNCNSFIISVLALHATATFGGIHIWYLSYLCGNDRV